MVSTQQIRCPRCGANLAGGERDSYACEFCGTTTPRNALVHPQRGPISVDSLFKTIAADFDQDGWFELCGWHKHALWAIDPVDKTTMWRVFDNTEDAWDLFAGAGRVYASSPQGLIALNAYTGERLWSTTLTNVAEVHDPGFVPNGVIWVLLRNDRMFAVNRETGAMLTSWAANDSAGLFRTLVGRNLAWNDASMLRILSASSPQPVLQIGTAAEETMAAIEKSMDDLAAGKFLARGPAVPDTVNSAVVRAGVLHVSISRGGGTSGIDAYRISDGQRVAQCTLEDAPTLVAAIAGHPISLDEAKLRREPSGPDWIAPGHEPEVSNVIAAGPVLIALVKRDDTGSDTYNLVGLEATSLAPIWNIDNIGYVYGKIAASDTCVVVPIGSPGAVKLVAVEPGSGAVLWEAPVPNEQGVAIGGGIVYQPRTGTALLADSGQSIFPVDRRTGMPAAPPVATTGPDELPDWGGGRGAGRQPAAAGASSSSSSSTWIYIVAVVVVLAIAGGVIAYLKLRHGHGK